MDDIQLLSGLPYNFGLCYLYPPKLKDLATLGELQYKTYLSVITFDKSDIPTSRTSAIPQEELDAIDTFDIICVNCNSSEEYKTKFEEALQYFIKEEVHFISDGISGLFYIGEKFDERFITRNNFSEMKAIISKMCCLEKTEEEDIMADLNIEDPIEYERIKQIRLRLKKAKARQSAEEKSNVGSDITLSDLISALCGISPNLNILQVWDLSIYQFYNQFQRVKLVDDYRIQFQSAMAGATVDDITHWLTKL